MPSNCPPSAALCVCRALGPLESPALAADEIPSQESHDHMVPMQTSWPLGGNTRVGTCSSCRTRGQPRDKPILPASRTDCSPHQQVKHTYLTQYNYSITSTKQPQRQPLQLQKRNLGDSPERLCVSSFNLHASDPAYFFCFRGQEQCLFSL